MRSKLIIFRHPYEHEISEFDPSEEQLERRDAQVSINSLFPLMVRQPF